MPIPLPKLDDRTFDELRRDAERLVRARCPAWDDLSPSDPGTTLLEVFAYLTDVMLYRLNRVPEKVHVVLLNLLGFGPLPPTAARAKLLFTREGEAGRDVLIPAGARVSDAGGSVTFTTLADAHLPRGTALAEVAALNAERVEGELLGLGSGEAGQSLALRRGPVLRETDPASATVLGVEAAAGESGNLPTAGTIDGRAFILWQDVRTFSPSAAARREYVLDRAAGIVRFGSGPGGLLPPKGREIRAWYWRGGGRAGNVGPDTLTHLRTPVAGVKVSNPGRASGGEDAETTEAALRRARDAVGVLRTAVTARDFARVAEEAGGIARAEAIARRDRLPFAEPGVVEVRVVPRVAPGPNGAVTTPILEAHRTPELLARVDAALAARRPLGVGTEARWTRCRAVGVGARVVVSASVAHAEAKIRLEHRLNTLLTPEGDWPLGRSLRASDAYEALLSEPGVRYVEAVRFTLDAGPDAAMVDVVRDRSLPRAFHAAGAGGPFRSLDGTTSWTPEGAGLPDRSVLLVRPDPDTPGLVAAVTESEDGTLSTVSVSADAGDSWERRDTLQDERILDAAWTRRDGRAVLLLATRKTMRRLDPGRPSVTLGALQRDGAAGGSSGFFAVASALHPSGTRFVAVAARERGGVLLSVGGGEAGTFVTLPDTAGRDLRVLAFRRDGDRVFLWAGTAAEAGEAGEAPRRIEARTDGVDPAGWSAPAPGWNGGSCEAIAFAGPLLVAASNRAGVLVLDTGAAAGGGVAAWRGSTIDSGLPVDDARRALRPVLSVATDEDGAEPVIVAATEAGLFVSRDGGRRFSPSGRTELTEGVPLPQGWLFCAGTHALDVRPEGEA